MPTPWVSSTALILALLLAGCSDSEPPPSRTTRTPPKGTAAPQANTASALAPGGEQEEGYRYDPTGKPDPFRSYVRVYLSRSKKSNSPSTPLERFDLSQLTVKAVIWGNERPRALITDPSGKGYIISEGTPIGKNSGRVIEIEDNKVVVKETYVDFAGQASTKEIEMRLHQSRGG